MELSQKQGERLVNFIAAFIINAVFFSLSVFFTEISFGRAMLYSLINSIWMSLLLLPNLPKITHKLKGKN